MSIDILPSDIALVVKDEAAPEEIAPAIRRLRQSKIGDVRVISAQAAMRNHAIKGAWIADWLPVEGNAEARGYLYLALSLKNKSLAKRMLKNIQQEDLSPREEIYYLAALSICHRSRKYMLKIMSYIYARSELISSEASRMCRMLIEDDDRVTLKFIETIERDRRLS
jgi:hypothetical protein